MRLSEFAIYEARMGAKDLSNVKFPPNLTLGFEAEVVVAPESTEDEDYVRDATMNDYSIWDMWSSWNWATQKDYIHSLEPKYGWVELNEYYSDKPELKKIYEAILDIKQKMERSGTPTLDDLKNNKVFYEFMKGNDPRFDDYDHFDIKSLFTYVLAEEYGVVFKNKSCIYDEDMEIICLDGPDFDSDDMDDLEKLFDDIPDYLYDLLEDDYREYIDGKVEEYMNNSGNTSSVDPLADALDRVTSYHVSRSEEYHAYVKDTDEYTVEPDTSIQPHGAEIVSPVFDDYPTFISELESVLDMIGDKFSTNNSTGLHINIGTFEKDEIDLLKLAVFLGEGKVLDDYNRRDNSYIQELLQKVHNMGTKDEISKDDIAYINKQMKQYSDKYRTINVNHLDEKGYLEFRAIGGEGYQNDFEKISFTISRYLRAIMIARDPNAYKEQYLKKLYKFFDEPYSSLPAGTKLSDTNKKIRAFLTSLNNRSTYPVEYPTQSDAMFRLYNAIDLFLMRNGEELTDSMLKNWDNKIVQFIRMIKKEIPEAGNDVNPVVKDMAIFQLYPQYYRKYQKIWGQPII